MHLRERRCVTDAGNRVKSVTIRGCTRGSGGIGCALESNIKHVRFIGAVDVRAGIVRARRASPEEAARPRG
eukprot:scaffold87654_cov69-Phaeocystis_antarctica.AAC.2